jgi:nitrate reductase gamma subunit
MPESLRLLENEAQIAALVIMALLYILRIVWLFKFKAPQERTPPRGSARRGIAYSLASIAMPWTMQSMVKHWVIYAEFVVFHLGIAVTITATFVIPYAPHVLTHEGLVVALQILVAAAFVVGLIRLGRRLGRPDLRLMSTPDDYFSLILLDVYLAAAFFALPNQSHWALYALFGLTTFFLLYVPFSKISHYLYYPFARLYFGRHFGRRGVYPKRSA